MPRIAQPLDAGRRQQLHAVAAEEFLTHGYERASLNRIIDRAGIAKSSFYYYFEDKRALHADLVAHLERTVREALHLPRIERLTADGAVLVFAEIGNDSYSYYRVYDWLDREAAVLAGCGCR